MLTPLPSILIPLGRGRALAADQSYRDLILADNPAGYWRLGEASGIVAADETGSLNGAYLPNTGGIWAGGTLGQAGALAGDANTAVRLTASSYGRVRLPSSDAVWGDRIAGTLEAWCKPLSLANERRLLCFFRGTSTCFGLAAGYNTPGKFQLLARDAAGALLIVHTGQTYAAGEWHHLVGTLDPAGNLKLYINGLLDGTGVGDAAKTLYFDSTNGQIGTTASATASFWDGLVDEVAVYRTALSPEQIQAHYSKGIGG